MDLDNILTRIGFILFFLMMSTVACSSESLIQETKSVSTSGFIDQAVKPSPTKNLRITTIPTFTPSQTSKPSMTSLPSASPAPSATSTTTITQTPELISSPTLTPTYAILRGTVLVQANCRYGPGAAYLYKYGLYPGFNLEIIGRNELGSWIVIQAIGGSNPCWVKASLLDITGDVMSLAPASLPLPQSPYYGPLSNVNAQRSGDSVVISWSPLLLRAGDDSLQYPYLIEAWICQDGHITFSPIGTWDTILTIQDDPGCSEPSHARIYGVEKHGYTNWVEIPWPQP